MQKIFISALFFIAFAKANFAQDHFYAVENDTAIVWQNVYQDAVMASEMLVYLSKLDFVKNLKSTPTQITGITDYHDFTGYGSSVPLRLSYDIAYKFTVDFKDDRYRVRISDIRHLQGVTHEKPYEGPKHYKLDEIGIRSRDQELRKNRPFKHYLNLTSQKFDKQFRLRQLDAEKW